MSKDLVNLAHRWPERAATHYEGCEADHVGCLVKKLGREVERLRADAERYQWLRSSQTHKVGCIEFGPYGGLLNGPELDAAVDRGMLASAKNGGHDE